MRIKTNDLAFPLFTLVILADVLLTIMAFLGRGHTFLTKLPMAAAFDRYLEQPVRSCQKRSRRLAGYSASTD